MSRQLKLDDIYQCKECHTLYWYFLSLSEGTAVLLMRLKLVYFWEKLIFQVLLEIIFKFLEFSILFKRIENLPRLTFCTFTLKTSYLYFLYLCKKFLYLKYAINMRKYHSLFIKIFYFFPFYYTIFYRWLASIFLFPGGFYISHNHVVVFYLFLLQNDFNTFHDTSSIKQIPLSHFQIAYKVNLKNLYHETF